MGMLSIPGNSNMASNASTLTPSEVQFRNQLNFLMKNGISTPQEAVNFMLDVIQSNEQSIHSEFNSLREDSLDELINEIKAAAEIYNRETASSREERKSDCKTAVNMLLKPVGTLLSRTQRYVDKVKEIDIMPKAKRILSPFGRLTAQVDNYSYCARICFEGAVVGMTYARAIDTELGGGHIRSLLEQFNSCVNYLTDGSRGCLIMSEYAANEDLEKFWLEIPAAAEQMINSGDWSNFSQLAEKSAHMQIAPAPSPAQIAVKQAKPGLFYRLRMFFSGFMQRLVFLFTGKPFEERTPQTSMNSRPNKQARSSYSLDDESVTEEPDYAHIDFR